MADIVDILARRWSRQKTLNSTQSSRFWRIAKCCTAICVLPALCRPLHRSFFVSLFAKGPIAQLDRASDFNQKVGRSSRSGIATHLREKEKE